jgi:Fe-S metabolism associated domain
MKGLMRTCCQHQRAHVPAVPTGVFRRQPICRQVCASAQTAADLPGGLKNIVGAFQMVPDPMARYKQLLYFASKLEGLEDEQKVEHNKVQVRSQFLYKASGHCHRSSGGRRTACVPDLVACRLPHHRPPLKHVQATASAA